MPNKIKYWREYYGLTQRGLAERAGMSYSAMNYIERGMRTPDVYSDMRIAMALRKTVEEIFGEEKEK